MNCFKCGCDNPDEAQFCRRCGELLHPTGTPAQPPFVPTTMAPPPQIPRKRRSAAGKVLLAILLTFVISAAAAVVLQYTGVFNTLLPVPGRGEATAASDPEPSADAGTEAAAETPAATPQSFDSPAAAVEAYLAALGQDNLDAVLAACAIDEFVENSDWPATAELYSLLTSSFLLAGDNPRLKNLLRQKRAGDLSNVLLQETILLLAPDNEVAAILAAGNAYAYSAGPATEDFFRRMEEFSFRDAVFLGYARVPYPEQVQDNLDRQLAAFGARDAADYVYLFRYGADYYVGGLTLYAYENGWKIQTLTSALAGLPATTGIARLEDYHGLDPAAVEQALREEYGEEYEYTILD